MERRHGRRRPLCRGGQSFTAHHPEEPVMSSPFARRHRSLIATLLAIALTLLAVQAVGAIRPVGATVQLPVQGWVIDPGPPPKIDSFHAWQTAPGTVEVQISVEYAYGVQLLFPGGT